MDIPLKISIPLLLKDLHSFHIVHFQDNTLTKPKPHWYILIRVVQTDNYILIIITSQKTNRINYYKNSPQPKASKCLVDVNNNDFKFLSRESAINCNDAKHLSVPEIVDRVDRKIGFNVERSVKVEPYLRKDIVSAILKSPLTTPQVKRLAKDANPI
jgi:hypothetical protein